MNPLSGLGKLLMVAGGLLLGIGAFLWLGGKLPGLGRLPGDIWVKRDGFSFYFPLTTCILLSIVVSLVLAFLRRH